MKTLILTGENGLEQAAELLKSGEVVGMPTETVYGLAANALDETAVRKIFAAKGRPADNPLIVHISDISQLDGLVKSVPEKAKTLAEKFWPGPLTMIFDARDIIPRVTTGGLDTVAVRFPSHPDAHRMIELSGLPIAAPSANISGYPSPTTADHVLFDMMGKIPAVFDGGECAVGVESTVINMTCDPPRLLRPGGVTPEQLEKAIGHIEIDPSVTGRVQVEKASSPGMKYKHYAPKAHIILLHGSTEAYISYVNAHAANGVYAMCFDEEAGFLSVPSVKLGSREKYDRQAHLLFSALRKLDELHAQTVFAHCPPKSGVGLAVYNRLVRAAGFDEITL